MTLAAGSYVVNTPSGLNLRADASTGARVVQTMPNGTAVVATGQNTNGFAEVFVPSLGGVKGWAAEQYLSPAGGPQLAQAAANVAAAVMQGAAPIAQGGQAAPTGPVLAAGSYVLTGDAVALRQVPAISDPPFGGGSNVIRLLPLGAVVTLTGANTNNFAQGTDANGNLGWISTRYLRAQGDPAGAPPPAAPPPLPLDVTPAKGGPLENAPAEAPGVLGTTSKIIGLAVLAAALYFIAK